MIKRKKGGRETRAKFVEYWLVGVERESCSSSGSLQRMAKFRKFDEEFRNFKFFLHSSKDMMELCTRISTGISYQDFFAILYSDFVPGSSSRNTVLAYLRAARYDFLHGFAGNFRRTISKFDESKRFVKSSFFFERQH